MTSWLIVAAVYFITAGQPIPEPLKVISSKSFASLTACVEYMHSDKYQDEKADMADQLKAHLPPDEAAPDTDYPAADDAPDATTEVAITTSCQIDNRL